MTTLKVRNDAGVEATPDPDIFLEPYESLKELDGIDANFKRRQTRISKAYVGIDDAKSNRIDDSNAVYVGYNMFDVVEPPFNLNVMSFYYDQSSAHKSAVNIKVANVVGLGYDYEPTTKTVMKLEELSGEQLMRANRKVERLKSALDEWLDDLNEEDTFIGTLEKIMVDLETMGNGYMEIGRTTAGEIGYIGHIPASTIRVRRARDGFVQIVGNKAIYFRNFQTETPNPINGGYRPNEIIHFKKYTPNDSYYGLPDIVPASSNIVGNANATNYNRDFFLHKATPRNIVLVKNAQLSPDAEDKLYNFLNALKGQHHRTLYIPLNSDDPEKDIDFQIVPVETKLTDMSFEKYHNENNREIYMAHNTPIVKSGAQSNANVAAALQADRTFSDQHVRPMQRRVAKHLNRIIAEVTDVVKIQMKGMALLDEATQSQIDERDLRWDVVTPNEVRERKGLPALKGGDQTVGVMSQAKLKQKSAEATAQANATRARDQARAAAAPDDEASPDARNAKGEGRQQS